MTLTTTENGEKGTAGEKNATEKAKKDAIRKALTTAVDQLGIEDPATASQLKAKISGLTFTQEQLDNGGTFKVKLDDGKTYILTYSAAGATVTPSTPTDGQDRHRQEARGHHRCEGQHRHRHGVCDKRHHQLD